MGPAHGLDALGVGAHGCAPSGFRAGRLLEDTGSLVRHIGISAKRLVFHYYPTKGGFKTAPTYALRYDAGGYGNCETCSCATLLDRASRALTD